MRRSVLAAALLASLGVTVPAFAEGAADDWSGDFGKRAERRSDIVLGFSPGLVLGTASGYPNEIDKIDQPASRVDSGFAAGMGFEVWLGGALKDWFTFGVGGAYYGGNGGAGKNTTGAGLMRVEVFPLYGVGGKLRDLAMFANFGAGILTIHDDPKDTKKEAANSGLASIGGFGVAYELARVGHFAFAPSAEYLFIGSQSLHAHQALLGARVVFYGGPG